MKPKTLIAIIVFLLVAAGIVFYFLSRAGRGGITTTGTTGSLPSSTTQTFPSGGSGQGGSVGSSTTGGNAASSTFGIVSNDPTLDYFVDAKNSTTLIEPNGSIETVANGTTTILSSTTIPNIVSASFSYDGKKILVNSVGSTAVQTSVFDIATKSWLQLVPGMKSPVWSPSGYQIAYLNPGNLGTETISLETITATSAKTAPLQTLSMEDSSLQWPNKNTLVITDRPSAFATEAALSFDIGAKTVAPLVVDYPGLESVWTGPSPMTGLVFSGNAGYQGGSLLLENSTGSPETLTFTTLPTKCAFHNDVATTTQTIAASSTKPRASSATSAASTTLITLVTTTTTLNLYCAVPRDQNTFGVARLPDEYDQKMFFTSDDFYRVGILSGTLSPIFSDPARTLDATDLKVFNGILFFVNRYDQKLYAIKLANS
jgi:hypothetical protein